MTTYEPHQSRYDLLAFNLVLALIAGLLIASVGSSLHVVQLLDGIEIASLQIDLAVGVAVNLGVIAASGVIFFAMAGALCCVWRNRVRAGTVANMASVAGWVFTAVASVFFSNTLLTVPLTLAVEVGL